MSGEMNDPKLVGLPGGYARDAHILQAAMPMIEIIYEKAIEKSWTVARRSVGMRAPFRYWVSWTWFPPYPMW